VPLEPYMTSPEQSSAKGYDPLYAAFDSRLMRQLRQEAYGEDIGQHSWVTADEFRSEIGRDSLSPPLAGFSMLAAALTGHWSSRSSRLAAWAPDWMSAHPRLVRDTQERRPPAFKTVSPSSKPI
jgi:hypothetical protein